MDRLVPLTRPRYKDRIANFVVILVSVAVAIAVHVIFFYYANLGSKEYVAQMLRQTAAQQLYTASCN